MKKILLITGILLGCVCGPKKVGVEKKVAPDQNVTIESDNFKLSIPAGAVVDTQTVRIEIIHNSGCCIPEGFRVKAIDFRITPENLAFKKPVLLTAKIKGDWTITSLLNCYRIVPLANSIRSSDSVVQAEIWHTGTYILTRRVSNYGIAGKKLLKNKALLLVRGEYYTNNFSNLKKFLKKSGYPYPIWEFDYPRNQKLEDAAKLLAQQLKNLHQKLGNFKIDIVAFGIGGLVVRKYIINDRLYQKDIDRIFLAIGTPFRGTSFGNPDKLTSNGQSNISQSAVFLDALGNNASSILPESPLMAEFAEDSNRVKHRDEFNINSFSGIAPGTSEQTLPELTEGDGVVSHESSLASPVQREPFTLDHFTLMENDRVYKAARDFLVSDRVPWWPLLDSIVDERCRKEIAENWWKQINLYFDNGRNVSYLLDFGHNLLASVPTDAILITNGDNDTFPLWYLQWIRGFRTDVLVANRSLLNNLQNVEYLKTRGLPITQTAQELENLRAPLWFNEKKILGNWIVEQLLKSDRPVYFSNTVENPERYSKNLVIEGLVYGCREKPGPEIVMVGGQRIDIEKTARNFAGVYQFGDVQTIPYDSINPTMQSLMLNYAGVYLMLARGLIQTGKNQEAIPMLENGVKLASSELKTPFIIEEANAYTHLDDMAQAESLLQKAYTLNKKAWVNLAKFYQSQNRRDDAIKIAAARLAEEPTDTTALDFLKKLNK
jgi:tetratricopeptide (TPR) repeat protein